MAAVDFTIGRGDTVPKLLKQLQDSKGRGVDLTAASTIEFNMTRGTTLVVDHGSCSIATEDEDGNAVTAVDGWVEYAWQTADTTLAGAVEGEFFVTWVDATTETFPNGVRKMRGQITQDIA